MKLRIIEGHYAVCKLPPNSSIPSWIDSNSFFSVTNTDEELSVTCLESLIPSDIDSEKNWALIKVEGPLDFSLTGILSSLTAPLAKNKISLFAISTFDTDYLLVKTDKLEQAQLVLEKAGFSFTKA